MSRLSLFVAAACGAAVLAFGALRQSDVEPAAHAQPSPEEVEIDLLYTINNLGYTDTCG
ncbi:MAG: hypothetical protein AAF517_21400 [Planctomycetota bacterium]